MLTLKLGPSCRSNAKDKVHVVELCIKNKRNGTVNLSLWRKLPFSGLISNDSDIFVNLC